MFTGDLCTSDVEQQMMEGKNISTTSDQNGKKKNNSHDAMMCDNNCGGSL